MYYEIELKRSSGPAVNSYMRSLYNRGFVAGSRPDRVQTSLHSYRDKLESCNLFNYHTSKKVDTKGGDQAARMHLLIYAFVVRMRQGPYVQ